VDPVSHLSTPMGCRNPLSHNADYCHCEFRRGCTQRRDPISGAAVSACKCGCDDRRAQSAPASDPRRSGTEGGTGPRRALYSPVSSRRSGLTRRGSRARSPNANSNHRREHTALRFRNQSLECIPQSIPRVPGKLRNLFLVATGKPHNRFQRIRTANRARVEHRRGSATSTDRNRLRRRAPALTHVRRQA